MKVGLTATNNSVASNHRCSAAEWVREAHRKGNRADAMIAPKTYEIRDHRRRRYATRVEVIARIYTLTEGRVVLETDLISIDGAILPPDCDRECVASAVMVPLDIMSQELADNLSRNANQVWRPVSKAGGNPYSTGVSPAIQRLR